MAQLETFSYSSASQCLAQSENEYVKIEHSKDRGRYFIAKTDVPAGTVVLKVRIVCFYLKYSMQSFLCMFS
jgi:hypothetical protein